MEELSVLFQDQSGCTVENGLEKSKDIRKGLYMRVSAEHSGFVPSRDTLPGLVKETAENVACDV